MGSNLENSQAQMRKGVLEFCILSILEKEEIYPSDIIAKMKVSKLIVVEGTLYPLLTAQILFINPIRDKIFRRTSFNLERTR